MIFETGVVVAIESDGLWVETIQKSACEVCVAEKGCGQKFLSKLAGKTTSIRVLRNKLSPETFSVGQSVTIGIPEDVIVMASLLVYLLPIVGAVCGASIFGATDLQSIGGALAGLLPSRSSTTYRHVAHHSWHITGSRKLSQSNHQPREDHCCPVFQRRRQSSLEESRIRCGGDRRCEST